MPAAGTLAAAGLAVVKYVTPACSGGTGFVYNKNDGSGPLAGIEIDVSQATRS
jgi:hypothetical protein